MTKKVAIIGADPVGSLEALLLVTLFDDLAINVFDRKPAMQSTRRCAIRHDTIQHVIDTLTALRKASLAEDNQFVADKIQTTIHFLQANFSGVAAGVTLSEQKMCALLKKQAEKLARINREVQKSKHLQRGELKFYFNQEILPKAFRSMTSNKTHSRYETIFAADGASSMVRSELFPDDKEHELPGLSYQLEVKLKKIDANKRHYRDTQPSVQNGLLHYWQSDSDGASTLHVFLPEALYAQFFAMKGVINRGDDRLSTNRLANLPPVLRLFVMQQIEATIGDDKFHADSLQIVAKPIYLQPARDSSIFSNQSQVMLLGSAELGLLLDDEDINLGFISAVEKAQAYFHAKAHCQKINEPITNLVVTNYILRSEQNIQRCYMRSLKRTKHPLIITKNSELVTPVVWPTPAFDLSTLERTIQLLDQQHKHEKHKYADWLYQADKFVATLHAMRNDPDNCNKNEANRKLIFAGIALATEFAQSIAGAIDSNQMSSQVKMKMCNDKYYPLLKDKPTYRKRVAPGSLKNQVEEALKVEISKDEEVETKIPHTLMTRINALLKATQLLIQAEEAAHQFDRAVKSLVKPEHAEIKQHLIALRTKMAAKLPINDDRQTAVLEHFAHITAKIVHGKLKSLSLETELAALDAKLFGRQPLSSGVRAAISSVLGAIAGFLAGLAVTAACSLTGPLAPALGALVGATVFAGVGFFTRKSAMKKYEAAKQSSLQQWNIAAEFNTLKGDFSGELHRSRNSPKIRTR